jgi:hypothetical protein
MSTSQNTLGSGSGVGSASSVSGVFNQPSVDDEAAHETQHPAQERVPLARPRVYTQNPAQTRTQSPGTRGEAFSAFMPLLLGGVALLGFLGFQVWQLSVERQALQAAFISQQQSVDSAGKLRATLDTLAADTQRLADSGNPTARTLVDELKKRGVTISTAPAGAASASAAGPAR